MQTRFSVGQSEYEVMTTQELRETFLVENLFQAGQVELVYWETDRTVLGGAVPAGSELGLSAAAELAADFFLERRELGVLNVGAAGHVTVDSERFSVGPLECLYVGRGKREVAFASDDAANPARYFLISYPAHAEHPTCKAGLADANQLKLGSQETANARTIFQYIHEGGIKSCQLVMGFTRLESGSVWNTMPPHTHARRSEVYLYFDVPPAAAVFHFMGPGQETRHLLMHGEQAALSPIWSIHSGCGTEAYSFIWAMGGENQRFADMDGIPVRELR